MVCASCRGTSSEPPAGLLTATDVAVFEAVVQEHDTSAHRNRVVSDRTLAMCAPSQHLSQCIGAQEAARISETGYSNLGSGFRSRNRRAVPIRSEGRGRFTLASTDAIAEIRSRSLYPGNVTIVEFGLPVYAERNLALVYVRYDCGNICGSAWYVRLRRAEGGDWHVASERLLSVS
jgi:hypothetical protein